MDCSDARTNFGPTLDAPRDESTAPLYEHVDGCDACQAFFRIQLAMTDRVGNLSAIGAPDTLRQRILRDLNAATPGPHVRHRRRWPLFVGPALAAAATFVILLPIGRKPTDHATMLVSVMTETAANRSMRTADPDPLRRWFISAVGQSFDIPDIPDAHLLGGKVSTVDGIQSAVVEYQLDGVALAYLLVPDATLSDLITDADGSAMLTANGYRVVMWMQDGTARAVVAAMAADKIKAIAQHCRAMA